MSGSLASLWEVHEGPLLRAGQGPPRTTALRPVPRGASAASPSGRKASSVGASADRRCEALLARLVGDGDTWTVASESQARLADQNRVLARRSDAVRARTAYEAPQGFRGDEASPCYKAQCGAKLPSPIASHVAPIYETAYGWQFGERNLTESGLAAKGTTGRDRHEHFTSWGSFSSGKTIEIVR